MKAASERDIEQVARTVLATSWVVMGQIWFGYEVRGLENLPPEGTGALLVYYHGALPVDYYFFLAYLIVHRPDRIPHSGRLKYSVALEVFRSVNLASKTGWKSKSKYIIRKLSILISLQWLITSCSKSLAWEPS